MLDRLGRTGRVIFVLAVVAVVLIGVATGVYWAIGSVGLTGLNVVVSGILTAGLVLLYAQQTNILDAQRELLTQELNREARQQHTETLRKRVEIWHGNPELELSDDVLDKQDLNLPQVHGASLESAPRESYMTFPEDETFHVIPTQLRGDRYLEDLLNNHAPKLRETAEEIVQLQEEFVQLRSKFVEEFDEAPTQDADAYVLEPQDRLGEWLFELQVLLERGRLEDFDELRERAWASFERGDDGRHSERPKLFIRVELGNRVSTPVYVATWHDEADQEEIQKELEVVEEEVEDIVEGVLDLVEANRPYGLTVEAAETLDAAAKAVNELENRLVEYHGRPIYSGDCEYLEETRIQDV